MPLSTRSSVAAPGLAGAEPVAPPACATPAPPGRPGDDIPVQDWQGQALACAGCPHESLRIEGGCEPGHSCMQDAYARRIDRFFRSHPALAARHLQHPYFEVRAIAARWTDVFRLPALMHDPDETVRLQVALRLPQGLLLKMRADPHREVRIRVAQRLDVGELAPMLHDADYEVRKTVARRLPEALLPLLMHDRDLQVRCEVARRAAMPALWRLVEDAAAEVRRIVAERLPAPLLDRLVDDPDWLVRHTVAGRAPGPVLEALVHDTEAEVREAAAARWAELGLGGAARAALPRAARVTPSLRLTPETQHG